MDCSFFYLHNTLFFSSEDPSVIRIEPFETAEIIVCKTRIWPEQPFSAFLFISSFFFGTGTEKTEKQQTGAVVYIKLAHRGLLY